MNKDIQDIINFDEDDIIIESPKNVDDFEFARNKLRHLLDKGEVALEKMIEIADLSQHPRSYEVVSTLIDSLSSASKDLLELAEKNKRINGSTEEHKTINNNLYISTAELQKLISKK